MITEDYVSFETAKLLKDKGFCEPCFAYYSEYVDNWRTFKIWKRYPKTYDTVRNDGYVLVPTLQMAMKWLREVHKIHIDTVFLGPSLKWTPTIWKIDVTIPESKHIKSTLNTWESYEDACEAAIKYCIEKLI